MPRTKVADSPSMEGPPRKQVDLSKAQGSSRNERRIARCSAQSSQEIAGASAA